MDLHYFCHKDIMKEEEKNQLKEEKGTVENKFCLKL
jgi:hypothetical protein